MTAPRPWLDGLQAELNRLQELDLRRVRRVFEGRQGVDIHIDGRRLTNFSSNDYLGLAADPRLEEALVRGARKYGVGSGASHLVCGHSTAHHQLEEQLADFLGRDRAVLFSTGYMANLGVLSALVGRKGVVYQDRLNHASLLDGVRLSGATLRRYVHGTAPVIDSNVADILVATDGVFSMDGDLMNGPLLAGVARKAGGALMVDDAHGIGVLGQGGRGVLELQGLGQDDVPVLMGTLGKAIGVFGAFVAGPSVLIDYLIQKARTYIYTTAMPPAVAEAACVSLDLVKEEGWRRSHLMGLVSRFRSGADHLGLALGESGSPIQPIMVGDSATALKAQAFLADKGFLLVAIRPPTVPQGSARLRCTLTAAHTEDHVDRLLDALAFCPELSAT